MAGYQSIP
jgi:hypothetical protein